MSDVIRAITLLAVVLVAVGWPAGRALSRRSRPWALATTPATAGLAVSAAVALSILLGTSMLPWLLLWAVVGWGWYLTHRPPGRLGARTVDGPGYGPLVAAVVVALAPVLLVDLPAVGSDARYIWWFHAAWFRAGGDVTREGMTTAAFSFSRSRYPPLLPGMIAAVWHLGGAYDRELALRVSQLFTGAAIAAAGFNTSVVTRLNRRGATVIAAAVTAVCWGANAGVGLVGFADLAWAALFVSGAVLALAGPLERRVVAVATVFAAAGSLVKFEAQVAALVLVVLVVIRAGRSWRRVVPFVLGVLGAIAAWQAVLEVAGATPDERGDWSQLRHLLDGGTVVHQRFTTAISHLAGELGPLVGLAVLGIVLAVAVGRWSGLRLRQPGLLSLLVLCGAYLLVVAFTFAVAPEDLDPYLNVAAYRTVIVVRILVLVDVALTCVAGARALSVLGEPTAEHEPGVAVAVTG